MPQQAPDRVGTKQVGVISCRYFEPFGLLDNGQGQVQLRGPVVNRQRTYGQPGQLPTLRREVLEGEHHLNQRRLVQAPLGLEFLHELLERQVLMRKRPQGHLTHPAKELGESGVTPQVGAQDQGVDEEADQLLGLDPVAARDGRTDEKVLLPAIAVHQHLECRQQRHEQGGSLPAA
jgi:hypothetical protein